MLHITICVHGHRIVSGLGKLSYGNGTPQHGTGRPHRVTNWGVLAGCGVTVTCARAVCAARPASWAAATGAAQVTSSLVQETRMLQQRTRSWAQSGQSELQIHATEL
jgi:hypothetical protein